MFLTECRRERLFIHQHNARLHRGLELRYEVIQPQHSRVRAAHVARWWEGTLATGALIRLFFARGHPFFDAVCKHRGVEPRAGMKVVYAANMTLESLTEYRRGRRLTAVLREHLVQE